MIDLSHPLTAGMPVYPGDPPTAIQSIEVEPGIRVSRLTLGTHAGTHMDAPAHFLPHGRTIGQTPLEYCAGPAVLVRVKAPMITPEHLAALEPEIRRTGKLILNTGWHHHWGEAAYFDDHPVILEEASVFLVGCGVHLVGIDAPSVDKAPYPAHRVLLGSGAVILENLTNLDAIAGPLFHLIALPLAVAGADGSPVRVVAADQALLY